MIPFHKVNEKFTVKITNKSGVKEVKLRVKEAFSHPTTYGINWCKGCAHCYFARFKSECSTVVSYCSLKDDIKDRNCSNEYRQDGKGIYYVAVK